MDVADEGRREVLPGGMEAGGDEEEQKDWLMKPHDRRVLRLEKRCWFSCRPTARVTVDGDAGRKKSAKADCRVGPFRALFSVSDTLQGIACRAGPLVVRSQPETNQLKPSTTNQKPSFPMLPAVSRPRLGFALALRALFRDGGALSGGPARSFPDFVRLP